MSSVDTPRVLWLTFFRRGGTCYAVTQSGEVYASSGGSQSLIRSVLSDAAREGYATVADSESMRRWETAWASAAATE